MTDEKQRKERNKTRNQKLTEEEPQTIHSRWRADLLCRLLMLSDTLSWLPRFSSCKPEILIKISIIGLKYILTNGVSLEWDNLFVQPIDDNFCDVTATFD